jgi:hypothetical protein
VLTNNHGLRINHSRGALNRISHQHSSTCDRNYGCESSNNNEETV